MDHEVNDSLDATDEQDDIMIVGGVRIIIDTNEDSFENTSENPFEN